ncbi:MAG: cation transporter [bacterium]|nr:cation transporter [bacterium]
MDNKKLWNIALLLAVITVFYNILEGLISIYFGIADETLTLFGFGVDSFVEVMSGIGVWHMIVRVKNNDSQNRDNFEKTALKVTGISFYILAAGLILSASYNIYAGNKPQTTFWGIIISLISIVIMIFMMRAKLFAGKKINSDAIIADANCTRMCIYLSIILLASSILYELFRIGYIDAIGALGIAYYSFKEGKESMDKAKGKVCCDCHDLSKT